MNPRDRYDRMVEVEPARPNKPDAECVAKCISSAGANLTRAREVLETIISSVEGLPPVGDGNCGTPTVACLMESAANNHRDALMLAERLDHLARLLNGSR
jgi:hypothetical protein